MRLGWSDGTIIAVGFTPKGKSKSSVAVQHTKLPDRETAERLRKYWTDRFDALGKFSPSDPYALRRLGKSRRKRMRPTFALAIFVGGVSDVAFESLR